MNESETLEILEKVLGFCTADEVEATISGGTFDTTRFADNVITQNSGKCDVSLDLLCAYGDKHASASTNELSERSLKDLVKRAQEAARVSPSDPEYMPMLEPEEKEKYLSVRAYYDETASLNPERKAKAVSGICSLIQSEGHRLSGAFNSGTDFFALANSAGLRAYHRSTQAEIHTTVLSGTGSGWAQCSANNVGDIDVLKVASESLSIAQESSDPTDIEPGKYTVILRAAAVEELLPHYMICSAKATDEGRTFLRGKLGKKVCGEEITIRSDPSDPRCPVMPFQSDGFALPKIAWVEKGVLKNLSTSRYWAKRQGRTATGWPGNVIMEGGDESLGDMMASTDKGILVTRFWYTNIVDPMTCLITGMTRDGLFLIEGGKIVRPVKHLRFNDVVPDVLSRVEAMGRPERLGRSLVPTLKIRDFNFTSTTKF